MKDMNDSTKQPEIIAPKLQQRELAPAGLIPATLEKIKDLGKVKFGEKIRHMILLIWITDARDSNGLPIRVFDRVHLTLHHKGTLASRIEAITGVMPREDEPYTLNTLEGGRALLQIKHRKTEKGTFANVFASFPIAPTPSSAAMTAPPKAALPTVQATPKAVATASDGEQKKSEESLPEPPEPGEWDPAEYDEAASFPGCDAAGDQNAA